MVTLFRIAKRGSSTDERDVVACVLLAVTLGPVFTGLSRASALGRGILHLKEQILLVLVASTLI